MATLCKQVSGGRTSSQPGSLSVGGLHAKVTEELLIKTFSPFGPISSVRVCRHQETNHPQGYGYVNFEHHADAARAMAALKFGRLLGKRMRIVWCQPQAKRRVRGERRDNKISLPGVSLYVQNLPYSVSSEELHSMFSPYGTVSGVFVMMEGKQNKGCGYVAFSSPEDATKALMMNGHIMGKRKLRVTLSQSGENTAQSHIQDRSEMTPLDVITEKEESSDVPPTDSVAEVCVSKSGSNHPEMQPETIESDTQTERLERGERQENKISLPGVSLYEQNLPYSASSEELHSMFSPYGTITGELVTMEVKPSKGCGYVAFFSPEDATSQDRLEMTPFDIIIKKDDSSDVPPVDSAAEVCGEESGHNEPEIQPETVMATESDAQAERLDRGERRDNKISLPGEQNLPYSVSSEELHSIISPYGNIIGELVTMEVKPSKSCGYVALSSPEDATIQDISEMTPFDVIVKKHDSSDVPPVDSATEVCGEDSGPNQPEIEPETVIATESETQVERLEREERQDNMISLPGVSLYVQNPPYSTSSEDLHSTFSPYGTVAGASVRMEAELSKVCGYVAFSFPEDATIQDRSEMTPLDIIVKKDDSSDMPPADSATEVCGEESGPSEPEIQPETVKDSEFDSHMVAPQHLLPVIEEIVESTPTPAQTSAHCQKTVKITIEPPYSQEIQRLASLHRAPQTLALSGSGIDQPASVEEAPQQVDDSSQQSSSWGSRLRNAVGSVVRSPITWSVIGLSALTRLKL